MQKLNPDHVVSGLLILILFSFFVLIARIPACKQATQPEPPPPPPAKVMVAQFRAEYVGDYRVTWYGKGKWKSGKTFRGKYHTAASRVLPKRSWALVGNPDNGKKVAVYVNDTFGPVVYKGKELPADRVSQLVDSGVLSAMDLAAIVAEELGMKADGHTRCSVWRFYPNSGQILFVPEGE